MESVRWNETLQLLRDAGAEAVTKHCNGDLLGIPGDYKDAVCGSGDGLMRFIVIEMAEGSDGVTDPQTIKDDVLRVLSRAQADLAMFVAAVARTNVEEN